jgi:hypothetical protein
MQEAQANFSPSIRGMLGRSRPKAVEADGTRSVGWSVGEAKWEKNGWIQRQAKSLIAASQRERKNR